MRSASAMQRKKIFRSNLVVTEPQEASLQRAKIALIENSSVQDLLAVVNAHDYCSCSFSFVLPYNGYLFAFHGSLGGDYLFAMWGVAPDMKAGILEHERIKSYSVGGYNYKIANMEKPLTITSEIKLH